MPLLWRLRIDPLMNIVELRGEAKALEAETYLLADAIDIIETGIAHKGVLLSTNPTEISNEPIAVYFSFIFPSRNEVNEFVKSCG